MLDEAGIRTALEAGLAESGLPGVVGAVRTRGGESVTVAIGRRSAGEPEPIARDALFWIASMTKAITSVAALQLAAEGRIGLDEPVGRWLPELAAPQVLEGFDDQGAPRLRPARKPVTLRALLSHTSGLAYDFTSADVGRWVAHAGARMGGPGYPEGLPLVFDPGEGWAYGYGLDVAGRLIERLVDADLESVLAERIFRPLGMTSTTFAPTEAQRARSAAMHARLPEGGLAPVPFAMPPPPHFQMGGGGLYSTADDYLRFLGALLEDEPRLLPPAFAELLFTPQVVATRPGVLKSAAPHLALDYDAFPGQPTGWTLGFLSNLEPGPAGRVAGSLSWAGLSNCYYWLDRETGVAGVMMAQLLPFADPGALALFDRFERAVYGAGSA